MSYSAHKITDPKQWSELPIDHWQQSFEYGELQRAAERQVERIVWRDEAGAPMAYAQYVVYPLGYKQSIAYTPYGPWISSRANQAKLSVALSSYARTLAQQYNLLAIRLELPNMPPTREFSSVPLWAYQTSFAQARGEVVLSLSDRTEEELWAGLSKSTKRNVNKSHKHHVSTQFFHGTDMLALCDDFIQLNTSTTHEHSTTTHDQSYFRTLFKILSTNPDNFLAVAYHGGTVHAMNVVVVFNNKAYCPFGASSHKGKQQYQIYYYLKWELIKYLLSLSIESFNWGGVSRGKYDPHLSGLNQFKLGFGGILYTHPPLYDIVCSWKYWLYLLRSWYKHARKNKH